MERSKIIETVEELPSETRVKAWMFQHEGNFYHVASYQGYRLGEKTSIWPSNKSGKRTAKDPIFNMNGRDHLKCINEFLDTVEKAA